MNRRLIYSNTTILPSFLHLLGGWSDANSTRDLESRHSMLDYIVFLNSLFILSWQSRKKPIVVLSFIIAEYIAFASATKKLLWLHKIIIELTLSNNQTPYFVTTNHV